ncbi:hypothetical protein MMPV_005485 [Pyropia vietnamensis]
MPPPVDGGLPSLDGATFDAVLVGTDLPQALLAAALSLAGRSVLHVDAGDGYGGGWATRPLGDWQAALDAAAGGSGGSAGHAVGGAAQPLPSEPPLPMPSPTALSERFGPGTAVVSTPHLAVGAFPPPGLTAWPPPAQVAVDVLAAGSVDDGIGTPHANGGSPHAPPASVSTTPAAAATPSAAASALGTPLVAAGVPATAVSRITLDQLPRPLLGAGALVPLLQSTSAGHYVEFVAVDGAYVHFGDSAVAAAATAAAGQDEAGGVTLHGAGAATTSTTPTLTGLHRVPTSRAEVFRSTALGPVDKRLLMRFLSACAADGAAGVGEPALSGSPAAAAPSPHASPPGETFEQYMVAAGLGPVSRAFLRHAVVGPSASASGGVHGVSDRLPLSAAAGVAAVRRVVASMAALAIPTALLVPRYGTGELPQAFARVAAVHGAVYALRTGVTAVLVREGTAGTGDAGGEQEGSAGAVAGSPPVVEETPPGVVGVVLSGGEVVTTSWLFAPPPPPLLPPSPPPPLPVGATTPSALSPSGTWRWVGITDSRLLPAAARPVVYVPAGATGRTTSDVTILSVDSGGRSVPEGLHAVSAATAEGGQAADLVAVLSSVFDAVPAGLAGGPSGPASAAAPAAEGDDEGRGAVTTPRVLWGALYWQPSEEPEPLASPLPPPVSAPRWSVVRAATGGVDADEAVAEAARCYGLVSGLPPFFAPPSPQPDAAEAGAATDDEVEAAVDTEAAVTPAVATGAASGIAAVPNGVHATGVRGGG